MTEQPEYFLILKDEVNFMRTSMFSDREECRKIMQKVIARPHAPYQSERDTCTASATFKRQSDCEDKTPSKGVCKDCHYFESERDTCPQNKIWQHCPAAEQIRKQERDKVLSLIRCFIEHEGFNCGETDAIKEYMKELRQAGEPRLEKSVNIVNGHMKMSKKGQ
jgi:hypothetical protein